MKTLRTILMLSCLLLVAGTVAAEVVIKKVPMSARDIAGLNGHQMYDQLCAVCHGADGQGDGPAAPAFVGAVPDLTRLSKDGKPTYSHSELEGVIAGRDRTVHADFVGMPLWETEFQYVRTRNGMPRTAYARAKIHALAEYVEGMSLASTD